MKKIIKLTESDLETIVKRVINEQMSLPTVKKGQKGNSVEEIQRALKLRGYNLGTGGPNNDGIDGSFGNLTKIAISQFQKSKGIPVTGQIDQITRNSLFSGVAKKNPYLDVNKNLTTTKSEKTIQKQNKTITPKNTESLDINIPLHYYAAIKFLGLKKTALTEREINEKTLNTLSDILCEKSMRMKTCNPDKWTGNDPRKNKNQNSLGYPDYTMLYSKSPSYKTTSFSYGGESSLIQGCMLTLGRAKVTGNGNGWTITDMYNFDNITESKPWLKTDNFVKMSYNFIAGAAKGLWELFTGQTDKAVADFEEGLSQFHNLGYKGFPVSINVPFNGCKCKF